MFNYGTGDPFLDDEITEEEGEEETEAVPRGSGTPPRQEERSLTC